jgi:hypothetical protein
MEDESSDTNDHFTIVKYVLIFATALVKLITAKTNKVNDDQRMKPPSTNVKAKPMDNGYPQIMKSARLKRRK